MKSLSINNGTFYSPKKMSIVYFKKKMNIVIIEHSFSVNVDM